jgi:hypothetical protein
MQEERTQQLFEEIKALASEFRERLEPLMGELKEHIGDQPATASSTLLSGLLGQHGRAN